MMMVWFVLAVAWLTVTMLMGMLGRSVGRRARLTMLQRQVDRDADEAMALLRQAGFMHSPSLDGPYPAPDADGKVTFKLGKGHE